MNLRERTIDDYERLIGKAAELGLEAQLNVERQLARDDLFYLLVRVLGRKDVNRDWVFDRCREVEKDPNGYLDLWAREHYKSTIITFGLTIRDILRDPEITVGIFSYSRPIAKAFLRQIKVEFEGNLKLRELFPDILWENPHRDAPKWSEDDGIVVRRQGNPKESTVEAWGLVDAQPTSKHYRLMVYDDVVTESSVTNPDMIAKVTRAWEVSRNLTAEGGVTRYIGTRWHHADTYREIIDRKAAVERRHAITLDGTPTGEPAMWTRLLVAQKRSEMGRYTFACLAGSAPILMADGTEKPISEIVEGDVVVGYTIGNYPDKGQYVSTRVVAAGSTGIKPAMEYQTEDGQYFLATADHKWFSGRNEPGRHLYASINLQEYHGLKHVFRYYAPSRICPDLALARWLGGMFDGEGSVSGNTVHIHQSPEHNPEVAAALSERLTALGLPFGLHIRDGRDGHKLHGQWYLNGGAQTILDFIRWCQPIKAQRIMDGVVLVTRQARPVKIVSAISRGEMPVYAIQTETGNYIAYGLLSKNSQMLLDPTAERDQAFLDEWLRYYDRESSDAMNKYILVDPASSKKKQSDYTSMVVIGLGADFNYYLLDAIRDRLSLTERGAALFSLHRRWRPIKVGYEKYAMQADIEYIKELQREQNYRFEILELGGQLAKIERIRRMVPIFEAGRFFLPDTLEKIDYQGHVVDLVSAFVDHEYRTFPVAQHDDMFDAISRICDSEMELIWPRAVKEDDRYARKRAPARRTTWMAA